jgi:hypothetical protein
MLSVLREARHTRKAGENAEKRQRIDEKADAGTASSIEPALPSATFG